ncbi:MAG: acyl carrier protein [Clostridia bacterium]|nr:acyl carrier protein [Clostridia bacterium]
MIDQMVIDIIAQILGTEASGIEENTLLLEDLGANSLDIVEIVTELEDTLKITIPDEVIPGFKTVGELIGFVRECK